MLASVLEKTVQGKRIPYLIWRSLAGFFDLQTVTLLMGAEGGLGKVGTGPTWALFPGSLVTFASCRDHKLTFQGLSFGRNGPG